MDSVGQSQIVNLHRGRSDTLVGGRNLWAGIGLVREGVGTALVGSYDEIADRIVDYSSIGIDEFILSAYPHLEEAERFGTKVTPLVRARLAAATEIAERTTS